MSEQLRIFSLWFSLATFIVLAILKVFHKLWWAPNRYRSFMRSQGIKGPSYEIFHGNTREILRMEREMASKPLSFLSHNIFPMLQPHVHLWTKLYGKTYIQWSGSQAQMMVTDTELVKELLIDRERVFNKPKSPSFIYRIFGDGIGMSNGAKWTKMRKLGNHAFHAESLRSMIPVMISSCEEMIGRLSRKEGIEVDVHKEFKLLTWEVISRAAFGSSYSKEQAIFESLVKLAFLASRNVIGQWISGIRKYHDNVESLELEKRVRKSIMGIIKKRDEKAVNKGEGFGVDFLGILLKAHHDEDEMQRISMDQIIEECKALYFAGQETTNSMLAWTIFILAVNPNWQEITRKEVLNLFGKQTPNPDGISKLKTMSMVINESLRLYPPVLGTVRSVEKNERIGKLVIPEGTNIFISILAIHHDPEIWGDDAHLFKPERLSEGVSKATKGNIAAFIPFGLGPRICLGFNFALIEAKITLAMILQRYSFTLSPNYVHSPHKVLTMQPQFGVPVMLEPL